MITTGTEAKRAAAISAPQKKTSPRMSSVAMPTGGLFGGGRDKRQGIDEVAPGQSEREDGDRKKPRYGDRQDNPDERLGAGGPIHHGALLQLFGDGAEITHQQPRPERDQEGGVSKNQGPEAVPKPPKKATTRERGMKSKVGGYQVGEENGHSKKLGRPGTEGGATA